MKLLMTLLVAALFSFGASYAHACGVDSVSGKTDTNITISWDVPCNGFREFEICWKNAANSGNVCIQPTMQTGERTGSYTIAGLQPETAYKIKTHWRRKLGWYEITTRIVTTSPSPAAITTVLRYEKESPQRYSVTFYWKNPPTPSPTREWKLGLVYQTKNLFGWSNPVPIDLTDAPISPQTGEYYWQLPNDTFSNNRRYAAWIVKWSRIRDKDDHIVDHFDYVSNKVEWK